MAAIDSTQTGDWDVGATWVGGVAPGAADQPTIKNTHVVTQTQNEACAGIIIDSGGQLAQATFNLVSSAGIINNGTWNNVASSDTGYTGTTLLSGASSSIVTNASSEFNFSGNIVFTVGATIGAGGSWTFTSSDSTIDLNGMTIAKITVNKTAGQTLTYISDAISSSLVITQGKADVSTFDVVATASTSITDTLIVGVSSGSGFTTGQLTTGASATITKVSGSKITVSGTLTFNANMTISALGSLTLTGDTKTITVNGLAIGDLIIAKTAGQSADIAGNFSALSLSGTSGTIQSTVGGTQRVITVTNTGTATNTTFKDISVGSANKVNAKGGTNTNSGNNLGIVFKDILQPFLQ